MTRHTVLTVLMMVAALAAAFAFAEHALGLSCEKCGARMRAFMEGDPEREDTEILECPNCGFLVNTRHSRR
jgi:hypothetical protein